MFFLVDWLEGVALPGSVHFHAQHSQIVGETRQDRQDGAPGPTRRAAAAQERRRAGFGTRLSFRGPYCGLGAQPGSRGSTGRPPDCSAISLQGQARTAARGPATAAASTTGARVVVAPAACVEPYSRSQ